MKKRLKINPYVLNRFDSLLKTIIVPTSKEDANATFGLTRELVQVFTTTVVQAYRESVASKFIPFFSDSLEEGVRSFEYNILQHFGSAILMERLEGNNIPLSNATTRTQAQKVLQAVTGYTFTQQELLEIKARIRRRATYYDLIAEKRAAAIIALKATIDNVHAYGDEASGTFGLANNPNVDIIVAPNGDWLTATGAEMEEDFLFIENTVRSAVDANSSLVPNFMVFPEALRSVLLSQFNPAGVSSESVLDVFGKKGVSITGIDFWSKLEDVPDFTFGNVDRAIIYRYDPIVLGIPPVPTTPVFSTPQQNGYDFTVLMNTPVTGVAIKMPVAVGYIDNLLS